MKRVVVCCSILLLVTTLCYAQGARNPAYNYEGKTNFVNASVQGLDTTGNPGYIGLVSTNGDEYYLWVDTDGDLRIASNPTMEAYASFPTGSWDNRDGMDVGTIVGNQS